MDQVKSLTIISAPNYEKRIFPTIILILSFSRLIIPSKVLSKVILPSLEIIIMPPIELFFPITFISCFLAFSL